MKSPCTLLSALTLFVSVCAFETIVLQHLGLPGSATGMWGVHWRSTAPQRFCVWWISLWLLGSIFATAATKSREPLFRWAVVSIILHAFPLAYEIFALLTAVY